MKRWNLDNSYAGLPGFFYHRQDPVPVLTPKPIVLNHALADALEIPLQPEVFAGNAIPEGAQPLAQAYAGHQFGYFTMLGDGRAILLGEQMTTAGERHDIQLKGAGQTPYSRRGDGRAALGPMLREYIVSEAMHGLGIPTTRSLAVVTTGETVMREGPLPGAILTRTAASHIRVGTFEYASHYGTAGDVRILADYTIERHFPGIAAQENQYLLLLREVVQRQAFLIAKWQLVGFIHGVMNTDNMAISGETIDFGPCAFMDAYHPAAVFSSIDTQGRYAYGNQPKMAAWNLARFAEALLPLLEGADKAQEEIDRFWGIYQKYWLAGMRAKLGLFDENAEDELLINDLLDLMWQHQADYTNTFRALTLEQTSHFEQWDERWQKRLRGQAQPKGEIAARMKRQNPAVIPRNHRVEEALAAASKGDLSVMNKLLRVLENPYGYTPEQEEYTQLPAPAACRYQTFCGT